jgi:hypothetical protein
VAGETRESGTGVQVAVVAEAATERRREKREMEAGGRMEKWRDGRKGLEEEKVQVAIDRRLRRDKAQAQLITDTSDNTCSLSVARLMMMQESALDLCLIFSLKKYEK